MAGQSQTSRKYHQANNENKTLMSTSTHIRSLTSAASVGLLALISAARGDIPDTVYIGDGGDNTVKAFDAADGSAFSGSKATFASSGLHGPRGILVAGGQLIVVDQNVGKNIGGEILQFRLNNGNLTGAIVPKRDPNGPFAPRGAVLKSGVLFVANVVDDDLNSPGQVLAYSGTGGFLGELVPAAGINFHPRGVVCGADGLLYVSNCPNIGPAGPTTGGQVLRFDPASLSFIDIFVNEPVGGIGALNRPEGLAFSPDGKLCITSFRATPDDLDAIRIYDGITGAFLDKIALNAPGEVRSFAQALLFGPGGKLYVPITATGAVRRYNLATKSFDVFLPAGALVSPWFLSFGRTNPTTLAYE